MSLKLNFLVLGLMLSLPLALFASVVDLHSHLASHLAYGLILKGGTPDDAPPVLEGFTHQHKFHQHLYRDWLKKSGVHIHLMAALPNVFAFTRDQAWKQVEEQLQYVEDFAKRYADDFVLAKTPVEAQAGLAANKIVLLHAIEGGEYLLDSQADANHWAKRGVAMIGPIHLIDIDYGDSCLMHGRQVLNWKGAVRRGVLGGVDRGLSDKGKAALAYMMKAGVVIDTAHMSPKSLDDTLTLTKAENLPVTLSHGFFREMRQEERGLTAESFKRLYDQGGLFGLTLGGFALYPLDGQDKENCTLGSVADFKRHIDYVTSISAGRPILALGTDSNGFVDHLAPCLGSGDDSGVWATGVRTPMDFGILTQQIAPDHWQQSGERFLAIWQAALDKRSNNLP